MRTKAEKKPSKKACEEKLKLSLPSPKVVLNANECARLLDGIGKTSVLLVEKGGKMVAATTVVSLAPTVSSSSSTGAATNTKVYNSLGPHMLADSKITTAPIGKSSAEVSTVISSNIKKPEEVPTAAKVILKPPKKRRGNDKKFEEILHTSPVVNNGDMQHPISPLREMADGCSNQSKTDMVFKPDLPLKPEVTQKHSVESLLQPSSLVSANNLLLGGYSHHSFDPRRHHLTQTSSFTSSSSISQSNSSDNYPSNAPYHIAVAQQSSQLYNHSSFNTDSTSQNLSSVNYSVTNSHTTKTVPYNANMNQTSTYINNQVNSDHAPVLSLPILVPSGNNGVAHSPSFQQLPEQEEPMNLSKSCKPALSLVTIQSHVSVNESRTAEDVSRGFVLQHSPAHGQTQSVDSQESPSDIVPAPLLVKRAEFKKTKKKRVTKEVILPPNPNLTVQISKHTADEFVEPCDEQNKDALETNTKSINSGHHTASPSKLATSPSQGDAGLSRQEEAEISQHPPSSNLVEAKPKQSSTYPEDSPKSSLSLSEPLSLAVQPEPLLTSAVSSEPLTLAVRSELLTLAVHSEILPMSNEPPSLPTTECNSSTDHHLIVIDHPSPSQSVQKYKKSPKKRAEIPMDEVSCASRISRYLETIEDVIANFVYIPGALEELKLREEEAAIIEEIHDNSKEKSLVGSGSSDRVQGESGDVVTPSVHQAHGETVNVTTSPVHQAQSEAANVTTTTVQQVHGGTQTDLFDEPPRKQTFKSQKPPKKRPTVIVAKNHSVKLPAGQEAQNTINHIDSVLAFVAADILNSTPPMESGLGDLERQKNSSEIHQVNPRPESKFVSDREKEADGNKLILPDKDPSICGVSSESKELAAESTEMLASKPDPTHLSLINNGGKEGDNTKTIKPKKIRKKQKPDMEKLPGVDNQVVPDSNLDLPKDSTFTPKKKKRAADSKLKVMKKKADNVPLVPNHETTCVPEKDILSTTRAETSDIGESIASTSGGSEQDTPVHEPESKDELVSSDSKSADKENQDTGLESGGDDNKPVRRYKKRLDFVKCAQCDHQARGRSALSRHMKKVHMMDVNMPYKCHQCDYGCTKMASLNRHLFTHGVYPCSRCNFVADERSKLGQHVMELHKDKLDMKLCKVCNRYIKCDQLTIEEHADACQGPTPFKCSECEKEFKYASSLRVHYHTHFPDQPKRFKCEQCDYRTNYKANLHKHHKNMHASRDRDVQCPECGKLFSTEDNMRRHRKVHTLVRPFGCEICKKTFKTSGALKGHHLIHTATRPHSCNIPGCNRSFRTPKFLKSHQEEFHRLVPKKFFCTVDGCNYSFFKRSHLKRHAITHTGERNFHCTWPTCNKSFRHADNLKVHFRSHTNEKPVQCHLCDFKCKQKNSLFWHKKKIHQIIDASVCPKRMESKLKSMELENCQDLSESQSTQSENEQGPPILEEIPQTKEKSESAEDRIDASEVPDTVTETQAVTSGQEDHVEKPPVAAVLEQSISTQTPISRERGPKDLYEFISEDEFEEETPGNFRRDKMAMTALAPLPPPPKELLRKNEILEMKEKERKEKAEKRELEKKEKAEKKEQEKKERAEKKEQEKKEKADKKEQEKKEKADKKLMAKKSIKKKLLKTEGVECEGDENTTASSKSSPEKGSKDVNTTNSKPSPDKKPKVKDEHLETTEDGNNKKSANTLKRKRPVMKAVKVSIPVIAKVETSDDKSPRGRKKKSTNKDVPKSEKVTEDKDEETAVSPPKRKKILSKKLPEEKVVTLPPRNSVKKSSEEKVVSLPPRASIKKSNEDNAVGLTPRNSIKKSSLPKPGTNTKLVKKKLVPPKRKPSARIKAKKKATAKTKGAVKGRKAALKKKLVKKKASPKSKQEDSEESKTEKSEMIPEVKIVEKKVSPRRKSEEVKKVETKTKSATEDAAPVRPLSPAYSEEIMLQGKASPYRDFSDADMMEEEGAAKVTKHEDTPSPVRPTTPEVQEEAQPQVQEEREEVPVSCEADEDEEEKSVPPPLDESSDEEVSNDIPLTPPRAPAPPPMESSEDEMDPEPEPAPISVPGPNTPFSVPAPNTPFSVPPPTNLIQQHSVHSDEAPMSAVPSVTSMEMHSQGSVEMQRPVGSVEMHSHGSVEMNQPHGSVEMLQMHGSVEMNHSHGSVEMHPHNNPGEMHQHSSVEMRSHGSVEMRPHGSVEMRSHGSVEIRPHGSVEMVQSLSSVEMHGSLQEPMSQSEQQMTRTPDSGVREMKYDLLPPLQDQAQTSEADKEYFDQYLKSLSAANNRAANGCLEPPTSGLRELEAMVGKSHHDLRELGSKSPMSSLPTGVITSLESTLPILSSSDLRVRMDVYERHHDSLYVRDTPSSLPRLSDRQTATPLAPNPAAFDAFSSLNSLHPAASGRENSYLRQPENLFPTPPVSSNFMAEAMFQRQAMSTPFLPPQPSDRSSLSRIPDTTPLRSNSSSLLRRPGTMPGADMFSSPSMPQAMPRNPFTNAWASQESRPTHWQTPYLPRQPNMTSAGSFFPSKDNYLTGREFMFDPSVRQSAERGMFPSLSSGQTQDTFQLERFDLSNYFPNAMTPYGSSTGTLDYTRSAHPASAKPFDERYRQSAAASASIPDFRGLPPSTGSSDMFSGLPSVNSGLFYASNPMSYHHTQHMTDNVNSAFLTHSTSAQHAMFERDFAAHRGLYPQNTPYPFIDERQYGPPGKLTHTHSVASAPAPQDRDLMSRSGGPEAPMQDPYRSMLYRY